MKRTSLKILVSFVLTFVLAFSSICVCFAAASVTVVQKPTCTSYYQGIDWSVTKSGTISVIGSFDISGTKLSYNGKTVEYTVSKWPNMYSKPDSGKWVAGKNTMRIYCDDFTSSAYATVEVNLVEIESISVVTPPAKTILYENSGWTLSGLGDVEFTTFDLTGLKLNVKYKDGTVKSVSYPENQLISWSVDPNSGNPNPGYPVTMYAVFESKKAPFSVIFLRAGQKSLGDVNGDLKINSVDALLILQYSVGKIVFSDEQFSRSNVNKDSDINSTDALSVLQYSVGQKTAF